MSVPDSERLYLQGVALGDRTHDQRSWSERLSDPQPPEVRVAAGVLSNFVAHGNELYAAYIAYELYNAGMLVVPDKLPTWEGIE